MEDKIRIGASACLLGQQVRFDGGHKHDRYLTNTLGEYLDFVPVCPEVEAGFPIPRETFRLFAREFTQHFPLLPVEEEGRLNDPKLRETFIEQIFTLKRLRETLRVKSTLKKTCTCLDTSSAI